MFQCSHKVFSSKFNTYQKAHITYLHSLMNFHKVNICVTSTPIKKKHQRLLVPAPPPINTFPCSPKVTTILTSKAIIQFYMFLNIILTRSHNKYLFVCSFFCSTLCCCFVIQNLNTLQFCLFFPPRIEIQIVSCFYLL